MCWQNREFIHSVLNNEQKFKNKIERQTKQIEIKVFILKRILETEFPALHEVFVFLGNSPIMINGLEPDLRQRSSFL